MINIKSFNFIVAFIILIKSILIGFEQFYKINLIIKIQEFGITFFTF